MIDHIPLMPRQGETIQESIRHINSAIRRMHNALESEIGAAADAKKHTSLFTEFSALQERVAMVYTRRGEEIPPDLVHHIETFKKDLEKLASIEK